MFEPREETISEILWDGESNVEMNFEGSGIWGGAKRKDFWNPEEKWEERIKKGSVLRLWTIGYSSIAGFQLFEDGKWVDVWCALNSFRSKEERDVAESAYADFIQKEGENIAEYIDAGKTLTEIDTLIDVGHSGNTYGWALNIGINTATNKDNAEKIRQAHNEKYNVPAGSEGVVNPAIVTISS